MKYIFLIILLFLTSCDPLKKFEGDIPDINDEKSFSDNDLTDDAEKMNDIDFEVPDNGVTEPEGLNCTGLITCYNKDEAIECPQDETNYYYGQDAYYAMEDKCISRQTTISGSGNEQMVTDNNTGLVWQRSFHGEKLVWEDAFIHCRDLVFGEYDDWRLPSYNELWTLAYLGNELYPTIDQISFPDTPGDLFWTRDKYLPASDTFWGTDFKYGAMFARKGAGKYYARCIRGKTVPEHSFKTETVKNDKTNRDTVYGLKWSATSEDKTTWKDALIYCNKLNYSGRSDWRLPNINELQTTVDIKLKEPASKFEVLPEKYWSSTTDHYYYDHYALTVDFFAGEIIGEAKLLDANVICVTDENPSGKSSCSNDQGCPEEEFCIRGNCYENDAVCRSDEKCPEGLNCFNDLCYNPDAFISKWNTSYSGVSDSRQIKLPLTTEGTYDFTVDWGDGTSSKITEWNAPEVTHTYKEQGVYTIVIKGTISGWRFCYYSAQEGDCTESDANKILEINQWGNFDLGNSGFHFGGCRNLDINASDTPDLSKTNILFSTFFNCTNLVGNESFSKWDTSNINEMGEMFYGAAKFNQDLSGWDTSIVRSLSGMFYNAESFNGDISTWNTQNVIDMSEMFMFAAAFNGDISKWNVSNVKYMSYLFSYAENFNADISDWDVSNVQEMDWMFQDASSFNQDISRWDISNVTTMWAMFSGASSFNSDISSWDTSNVKYVVGMFGGAESFNCDLSGWNTSKIEQMTNMFQSAKSFNGDITTWDVSNVFTMENMFRWADSFNQDISGWDVSNVNNMESMFQEALSFDQDISDWDISSVFEINYFLKDAALSTANYDQLLIKWSELPPFKGITFDGGNSRYSETAEAARIKLIEEYEWTITDGGKE